MTVYWCGTESESFNVSNRSAIGENVASDSPYSRAWTLVSNAATATDFIESINHGTNLTDVWVHWKELVTGASDPTTGRDMFQLVNASGTVVFKLTHTSATGLQASYWNGSTYTNIGSAFDINPRTFATELDVHLVCGASGSVSIYKDGNLVASGTFSDTDCDNVRTARWLQTVSSTGGRVSVSQGIMASVSTVGWKVYTKPPTGNGANTAWTGAFGDVDESQVNDVDVISGAANGDRETYTGAALTLTGFEIKAVAVSARVKRDAGGPQNLQMVLRKSSTNYDSANVPALSTGFDGRQAIWGVDPSTSAAWAPTDAGASSLEFGLKAVT